MCVLALAVETAAVPYPCHRFRRDGAACKSFPGVEGECQSPEAIAMAVAVAFTGEADVAASR